MVRKIWHHHNNDHIKNINYDHHKKKYKKYNRQNENTEKVQWLEQLRKKYI